VALGLAALAMSAPLSLAWALECGAVLGTGSFTLDQDVVCGPENADSPAITVTGGATLHLNRHTVDCNGTVEDGIVITGTGATILQGTVMGCTNDGVSISGDQNQIVGVLSQHNERRGFEVEGDDNHLVNSVADANGQHGFKILGGNGNEIRQSKALNNCRDGIEIEAIEIEAGVEGGTENLVSNNVVANNGNQDACLAAYRPWFYAGIDILLGASDNTVMNNQTTGNKGCVLAPGQDTCVARERNLWDENVNDAGTCVSTNQWVNNHAGHEQIAPECTPGPP
jgi:hypothetical protein